jgi:hypothetical protein
MRILERLQAEMNNLPSAVAWLACGPEESKRAVRAAKRKLLLIQAPIALGTIAAFSVLLSLGVVQAKGHMQLIAHFCAVAAFMWPPTLFSICLAARRDIPEALPERKNQLRLLFFGAGLVSVLSVVALVGVAALYAHTLLNL